MMVGHNRYGGIHSSDSPPPIWHHYRQLTITTILWGISLLSLLNGEFENCCQNVKTTECDDTNWPNSTECKGLPSGFPTILKPPRLLVLLITTFHIVKHYLTIDFDSETWRTVVCIKNWTSFATNKSGLTLPSTGKVAAQCVMKKWLKIADGLFARGPAGKNWRLIRLIPLDCHDIHQRIAIIITVKWFFDAIADGLAIYSNKCV